MNRAATCGYSFMRCDAGQTFKGTMDDRAKEYLRHFVTQS
ncbi:MAG: HincII family type II restriction endonuclease [Prevotellaceae bacterium]|nr:HincII family type II restriction endonuclease [Prevotellaceae bacterium]